MTVTKKNVDASAAPGRRASDRGGVGFTLVELVVTVAVAAIILTLAIPSLRNIILNNRRAAVTNQFLVALSYARGQAISLRQTITVCRSGSSTTSTPSCDTGTTGTGWENGWVVFVDCDPTATTNCSSANDGNGTIDTNDVVLRKQEAVPSGTTLHGSTNVVNRVTFNDSGIGNGSGSFALCDTRGWGTDARVLALTVGGRAQTLQTSQQSTITSCSP